MFNEINVQHLFSKIFNSTGEGSCSLETCSVIINELLYSQILDFCLNFKYLLLTFTDSKKTYYPEHLSVTAFGHYFSENIFWCWFWFAISENGIISYAITFFWDIRVWNWKILLTFCWVSIFFIFSSLISHELWLRPL